MTEHVSFPDADGLAALGTCESLLLALADSRSSANKTHAAYSPMLAPPSKALLPHPRALTNIMLSSPLSNASSRAKNGVRH